MNRARTDRDPTPVWPANLLLIALLIILPFLDNGWARAIVGAWIAAMGWWVGIIMAANHLNERTYR
jgi:hypothetical protein